MITLVANTAASLVAPKPDKIRYFRVMSDSTTVTRISTNQETVDVSNGGFGITAYESVIVEVKENEELFAKSAGTPNISIAKISHALTGEAIKV